MIPVLDVKDGRAVHAVAGRRAHYQPVASVLHPDPDPLALARAFHEVLGLRSLYLADLDAIAGDADHSCLYSHLISQTKCCLWIDSGSRDAASIEGLLALNATIVVGLETVDGPRALAEIVDLAGAERVVFSLDLDHGRARTAASAAWPSSDPLAIAEQAADRGVGRMLLLDLARVGTGEGLASIDLLQAIRRRRPDLELALGGGIASIEQVATAKRLGAAAVLVASALHDGRIGRAELGQIEGDACERS